MIGEIRDLETASIATNASLTGHLVFSPAHQRCSFRRGAFGRHRRTAVSRRVFGSRHRRRGWCGVSARIAKNRATWARRKRAPYTSSPGQLREARVMRPVGCSQCRQTGYKGRLGIFEIFIIDDEVRHMINKRSSTLLLRQRPARTRDENIAGRWRAQSAGRTDRGRRSHFHHPGRCQLTLSASPLHE